MLICKYGLCFKFTFSLEEKQESKVDILWRYTSDMLSEDYNLKDVSCSKSLKYNGG